MLFDLYLMSYLFILPSNKIINNQNLKDLLKSFNIR